MKQFVAIIFTLIVSANAAHSGYSYPQPQRQQPQPIRPSLPHSYSPPPPQPQYSQPAPPAISLPAPPPPAPALSLPAPHEISVPAPAPAPISLPQQQYLPPHQQGHSQQGGGGGFQQSGGGGFQQGGGGGGFQQGGGGGGFQQGGGGGGFQQTSFQRPQQAAIITKDIFIHSAPEDHGSEADLGQQFETGPVRKNYRIVFIKAPSQNLRGAAGALKRAQAQNEEKTIIYVLSKKPDLSEVSQQLQQVQVNQRVNKPEVYFIKYKTQEEAQRAQQEIQAQYDALGGSTHISDEGVAPVTTVGSGGTIGGGIGGGASYSQGGTQQQSFAQQSYQSQSSGSISKTYLPVKTFKK